VPEQAGVACSVRGIISDTRPDNTADDLPPNRPQVIAETLAGAKHPNSTPTDALIAPSHLIGLAQTAPDPRNAGAGSKLPGPDEDERLPRMELRGYTIERELGRGGMGAVYLGRQLSLDRPVALKVMSKKWASDPVFVARFTREAYAAAQLAHPNIVAIHDIGEVDGYRFFTMEYVCGQSLAEVLKRAGKLDPETAVGYILQAARGLKHAHDRGMIHRDVKPDNLLLDDQGLIKVADLGLVKRARTPDLGLRNGTPGPSHNGRASPPVDLPTPTAGLTGERIALGTPAYMSPEQCRDAAKVDHRADIYSLGCTLYVLVTGRPPFDGITAVELMTKHAYEPIVPPEQIVARVPAELSAVIQRMMAKDPADRFQNMGEVIRTLEAWLGVRDAGTFCPREDQIGKLETYTLEFNAAPAAVLRSQVIGWFFASALLAAVLLTFFGQLPWAFGVVGLVVQSVAAYFVIDGLTRKGHLFTRVRQFVWGLPWWDWVVGIAVLGLFAILMAMLGVLWIWAGFGLVGVGLALALRCGLDRAVERQRHGSLDGCEKLLRRLRAQGLDEGDLRQFVAKFAGRHWEEFFEALFGYEAKLTARAALLRGGSAGPRERHAGWRDVILAAIDRFEKSRQAARERTLLQAVEQARLQAAGLAEPAAKAKAAAAASAMVREAGKIRNAEAERARIGQAQPSAPPANVAGLTAGSSNPDFALVPPPPNPATTAVGLFVGTHIRAAVAAVLIAAWGLWAYQNELIPGIASQTPPVPLESIDPNAVTQAGRSTTPLVIDGVPPSITSWADSFNTVLAGLVLLVSLFYRGNLMGMFVLLGAIVAVAGHRFGVRPVPPLQDFHVALMLGSVLALVGFRAASR
jgi:serine/threonine protein kinase